VKDKLARAVATVMGDAAVRSRLVKLDIIPDVVAGPALQLKLESEIRNWTRFIDEKGIKAE
jgi:tripartite-type tricarboxylate transporter receptor subunit TctC